MSAKSNVSLIHQDDTLTTSYLRYVFLEYSVSELQVTVADTDDVAAKCCQAAEGASSVIIALIGSSTISNALLVINCDEYIPLLLILLSCYGHPL